MSRASVAERAGLSVILARRLFGSLVGRVTTNPIVSWLASFGKPDRLVIAPQDLRTTDATRASEIYSGRFAFAGKVVVCELRSPFEMTPPSDDWAAALFGFGWLRHLRAAESAIARANACALVDEWIGMSGARNAIAWRPEIVARRIIAWISQAPLMLDDSNPAFYRRFMRSLARQIRHLSYTLREARDGVPRLQAVMALTYAALCVAGQQRYMRTAARRLTEELGRQILPDGGHISRNPGALIPILIDLLPLRTAFTARNLSPPSALLNAIDRMMPMLRFFRHGDGNFALFNGMGPTPADLVTTILAYDDARGAPLGNAPHSGYQRLESAGTPHRHGYGPTAPIRGEPGSPRGVSFIRALGQADPRGGKLRCAPDQPRQLASSGACHRCPFHRDVQRHLILRLRPGAADQATARRHPDGGGPAPCCGRARGEARRHGAGHLP